MSEPSPDAVLHEMLSHARNKASTNAESLATVEKALARSVKARDLLSKSAKGWSDLHEKVTRQLATVTEQRDEFLVEITDLHREYVEKDCDECNGKGTVEDTILANYPSRLDPMVPAEETVTVTCDVCLGTKKEWGV